MKALLITLGHNSSAIFYDGKNDPIGFEEERLNGVKSSSAFPKKAISKIHSLVGDKLNGSTVYISHWFDKWDPKEWPSKYYSHEFMDSLISEHDLKLVTLDETFTHHDAHAYSVLSFAEDNSNRAISSASGTFCIVADGFGNRGEVISIYSVKNSSLERLDTITGFRNSLGLLYQTATSFCGMKENQDEYKFLGYESKIGELVDPVEMSIFERHVDDIVETYINFNFGARKTEMPYEIDPKNIINYESLEESKSSFTKLFEQILKIFKHSDVDVESEYSKRILIGYVIQRFVEGAISAIIDIYKMEHVLLAGGLFYNVKLNNSVLRKVAGSVTVTPLAGDQGAAIGMYRYFERRMFYFGNLCYGVRPLKYVKSSDSNIINILPTKLGAYEVVDPVSVSRIADLINSGKIVNLVRSNMEFGPRALTRTSTLALPTQENVDYINHVNGRNTIMPMAPVLTLTAALNLFDDIEMLNTIGSNKYMVITHTVNDSKISDKNIGVMHSDPLRGVKTARPQITSDSFMQSLLAEIKGGILINTSFNTHGTPILYSTEDCVRDFSKQREKDYDNLMYLVFINSGENS